MRSTLTVGVALLLTLGFVTLAAPSAAAGSFCREIPCCSTFETFAVNFARCVSCVAIGGVWNVGTDQCFLQ